MGLPNMIEGTFLDELERDGHDLQTGASGNIPLASKVTGRIAVVIVALIRQGVVSPAECAERRAADTAETTATATPKTWKDKAFKAFISAPYAFVALVLGLALIFRGEIAAKLFGG
jgi:hypothetical protein